MKEKIENFRKLLQDKIQAQELKEFPQSQTLTYVEVQDGKGKFTRIVLFKKVKATGERMEMSANAYGFIDNANGDLLKAAGWKAPAKGARGSILNADPLQGCGPYGMAYKKGMGIGFND